MTMTLVLKLSHKDLALSDLEYWGYSKLYRQTRNCQSNPCSLFYSYFWSDDVYWAGLQVRAINSVCKILALSNLDHWPCVKEARSSHFQNPEDIVSKEIMEWHSVVVKFRFVDITDYFWLDNFSWTLIIIGLWNYYTFSDKVFYLKIIWRTVDRSYAKRAISSQLWSHYHVSTMCNKFMEWNSLIILYYSIDFLRYFLRDHVYLSLNIEVFVNFSAFLRDMFLS